MARHPRPPPGAAARRLRGARRRRGRHGGRLVLRRLPDGPGRDGGRRRRPAGARGRAVAGRDGAARPHRPPHRRGQPVGEDVRRPARPPREPDRQRRSRRPGAPLRRDRGRWSPTRCRTASSLRDLGEHRLKDLEHPERLWQLVIDGLQSDFPAVSSLDATPNNLPTRLTTFLGRDAEIEAIGLLLADHRLLTLTGPGGTGKTRLSLEVAGRRDAPLPGRRLVRGARDDHRPGPRPVDDRADARPRASAGGRTPIERVIDHLGCRRALLVLDNFEQVLGRGAIGERAPRRLPEPRDPDQQPKRAAGLRRAGVPGSAARPAGPGQPSFAVAALPVRGRRAVHRARSGGPARVRGHERERAGGRRDLRPPRRPAAGDRARRGADPGPDAPGDARRGSGIGSGCCRRARATFRLGSRPCAARSPGATTCSRRTTASSSLASRCSSAARGSTRSRASAAARAATPSTG